VDRTALARAICQVAYLRGSFRLRSGADATEYFDKYRLESDPRLLWAIAEALRPLIPSGTDALAGLELGGVPLATLLSQLSGLPTIFVRKAAKAYGTAQLAEGGPVAGKALCVIEDVITSAGQALASAVALRGLGARVDTALCIIDREAGGAEALAKEGLTLRALFRSSELAPFTTATGAPAV
jgi:orotate phosphoribosyltransferase